MKEPRIIFMGTPDFAVPSLDILLKNGYNIVGVVTAADKPAGRGQQIQQSPIKKYAVEKGLTILQPEKLRDENFLYELKKLKADLQIVVAFRMLPESVWNMPELGTINLHGSLLPQYRGAAPINWAIINGETQTGVSTFFLQQEIDTGKIIFQEKIAIPENETAGELHDRMMISGADLILKTVKAIETGTYPQIEQATYTVELKPAPKIFKESCKIDWRKSAREIHDFIRGLSPYPAAWTDLTCNDGKTFSLKIFKAEKEIIAHSYLSGTIISDGKLEFKIAVKDGFINISELQLAGKKKMPISEFLRGFSVDKGWKAC